MMNLKAVIVLILTVSIVGCATPLSVETDYSSVKKLGIAKSDVVKISYCGISTLQYRTVGVCVLGRQELAIYPGKSLGEKMDDKLVRKIEFGKMKKIIYLENMNSSSVEVVSAEDLFQDFSFQISPKKQFIDQDETLWWFNYMKNNGVKAD